MDFIKRMRLDSEHDWNDDNINSDATEEKCLYYN